MQLVNWNTVALAAGMALVLVGAMVGTIAVRGGATVPSARAAASPVAPQREAPSGAPASPPDASSLLFPADAVIAGRIARAQGDARDRDLCAIEAQSDASVTYGLLERDPDRFAGRLWTFAARTIQVQEVPGMGTFLLVTLDRYGGQIVSVGAYQPPSDSVVADRRVRVYGRLAGTYTYTGRDGNERTVPKVLAVAVLAREEAPRCARR